VVTEPRHAPEDGLLAAWVCATRQTYDRLGVVMVANVAWVAATLGSLGACLGLPAAPAWARAVGAGLSVVFVAGPASLGLYRVALAVSRGEDVGPRLFLSGFGRLFPRAAGVAALNTVVVGAGTGVALFWLRFPSLYLAAIGCVWAWLVSLWCLSQCVAWPLLADPDVRVAPALRVALCLTVARLPSVLAMVLAPLAGLAVCALPAIAVSPNLLGLPVLVVALLFFAHAAFVHTHVAWWLVAGRGAGAPGTAGEPCDGPESEE